MDADVARTLQAYAAIGTFLVTLAGLIAVYFQLRKLRDSIWNGVHSKLCDQGFELLKFLAKEPRTYDYFYRGEAVGQE